MNAIELFHQDGKPAGIFYCEQCRIVHKEKTRADECCAPAKCPTCGVEVESKYNTDCLPCSELKNAKRERKRFEAAEKLTEWDGPIYIEGYGLKDGFFAEICDLLDDCASEECQPPKYAWACDLIHFAKASIGRVLDGILDEAYEDFEMNQLVGLDELKAAIEKFNQANYNIVSWSPNYKKAVLIKE